MQAHPVGKHAFVNITPYFLIGLTTMTVSVSEYFAKLAFLTLLCSPNELLCNGGILE